MWNNFNSYTSQEYRASHRGNIIPYPVEYLNRALLGVTPTDLVFIGAKSGSGKTEFAVMLAQSVAMMDKQVYYFALEADRGEIETRLLYREFADVYYRNKNYESINYRDFSVGVYDGKYRDYIQEAGALCNKKMQNVHILYRQQNFTPADFEMQISQVERYADCVILDHVHHFDMDTDRETQELKRIVKKLRDINIIIRKPIVCIAHFRKADRRNQELVPGFEELYGSSEIAKEATQVITLGGILPDMLDKPVPYHLSPTLFRVCKFRRFSPVCRYVGLVMYDNRTHIYNKEYKLYKLVKSGTELEAVDVPDFLQKPVVKEVEDVSIHGNA